MTNFESIDPDSVKEVFARSFAVDKRTGKVKTCSKWDCVNCLFYESNDCIKAREDWLDQSVFDPEKDIDWSKVPVDTPVLVWNLEDCSYKRHFSGIKDGRFGAYSDGRTSWSSITGQICYWYHCKLYRPEDVEKYRKKETENG